MLLKPGFCVRAAPLFLRSRIPMPLRSKILDPAFTSQKNVSTSSSITNNQDVNPADDVLFNSVFGVRTIELNRPAKLNALNRSMVEKIIPRLLEWEKSQLANIIILKGAGKALCAGGDVSVLAELNKTGPEGVQESTNYFGLEYQLDHLIATYTKPYIAFMDGFTMGGGVGLSVHAPFRIATENTVFAMPETKIGFFPDVGGTFFLPRLDGYIGTYLALTSETLSGIQALYAGIATHYIHSSSLPDLEARLSELTFDDWAVDREKWAIINSTIEEFVTGLPNEPIQLGGKVRETIDSCFSHNTIEEIITALEKETPLESKETSFESKETPLESKENPLESKETPLESKENPLESKETPFESKETPLESKENPLESKETPFESKETPLESKETPLESKENPLESKETPLESKENPLESKETPLESKEDPLESKENPLESKETPLEDKETSLESKETPLEDKETSLESENPPLKSKETPLESKEIPWPEKVKEMILKRSPTSLRVTLRLVRLGINQEWTISEAFQREYSVASKFMKHPDFTEGVDALLLTKPERLPKWSPATLEEITDEDTKKFVTPTPGESRLMLLRDSADYSNYPHGGIGLPAESEVEKFVRSRSSVKNDVVRHFVDERDGKVGVAEKVWDILQRKTETGEDRYVKWKP